MQGGGVLSQSNVEVLNETLRWTGLQETSQNITSMHLAESLRIVARLLVEFANLQL